MKCNLNITTIEKVKKTIATIFACQCELSDRNETEKKNEKRERKL